MVRIRRGESDARHRRRDRRQWRPALAGHRLHPAASLHGRRGGASRAVGLRARRHGRGLGRDRGIGAGQRRGDPHQRGGRAESWCATGAHTASCWRTARRSRARKWRRTSTPSSPSCACSTSATSPAEFVAAIRHFRIEGTSCKINLALSGLPEFTRLSRRARPAPSRDDAHLPEHRIRRARLGRCQVRPPVRTPAARTDHPDHVRPVARAAGQAHHGHLPAVCAVHAARGHLGRIAGAVRRSRDRH